MGLVQSVEGLREKGLRSSKEEGIQPVIHLWTPAATVLFLGSPAFLPTLLTLEVPLPQSCESVPLKINLFPHTQPIGSVFLENPD